MTVSSSTADQGAKTVMDYEFPKGYIMQVELELWADGAEKIEAINALGEDKEALAELQAKHLARVQFDLGGCTLRELLHKLITTSNSPRVAFQNSMRPKYESNEEIETAFKVENSFTFVVKDWVENARQKLTDEEKAERAAKKALEKMTPEAAAALLAKFTAPKAEAKVK